MPVTATRRPTSVALVAALSLAGVLLPQAAMAQTTTAKPARESGLTLYGGARFGGSFTDANTNQTWELQDGGSLAGALDIGIDRQTQFQVFVGHQNSSLKASGFAPTTDNFGLDVTYYHVGGTYFFDQVGRGGYVVGGLGATVLKPEQSGLNSETKASANIGIGYMIPLGRHFAVRLEARGYGTLLNNSGGLFCGGGGCAVSIKGQTFTQGEVLAGVSLRF
jgi:hypothetical protein